MILYKIKRTFQKILSKHPITAKYLALSFLAKDYLRPKGWFKSKFLRMPLNGNNEPIPWFTYSSISFISQKLVNSSFSVFEFGSGNSTLYFASKVKQIVSIEYNAEFYQLISEKLKSHDNVDYIFASLGVDYSQQILNFNNEFDIVIIDGRERIECAKNCISALKKDGVIIWDNSDRKEYHEGYLFLEKNGFRRIDFKGHGPISSSEWETSIFYRNDNCFGI
jgi:hypothetical protein